MSIKSNIGQSGYADVRLGKTSVRVTFKDGNVYELAADSWNAAYPSGQYNVTLDKNGTKIIVVRPIAGTYVMEFVEIGNRINEIPEPKIAKGGPRQSKDGKKKWFQEDRLVWTAKVEVLEGKYAGLNGSITNLAYGFTPIPNSPFSQIQGSKGELEKLEEFFRVNGFDVTGVDIPYSTNVLPWLEKKLGEVKRPFLGTFNEAGFINELSELPKELAPKKSKKK